VAALWRRAPTAASFTIRLPCSTTILVRRSVIRRREGVWMVGAIAIAMFVALVGFGGRYFGWDDPEGRVQLALITSFILGIIGGYKAKG
jgi:hypothetical protein